MRTTRPLPDHRRPAPLPSRRREPRPMGSARHQHPAAERGPEAAARSAGGPEDRARYECGCGCDFRAPVSTTVGCPRCGATQAW